MKHFRDCQQRSHSSPPGAAAGGVAAAGLAALGLLLASGLAGAAAGAPDPNFASGGRFIFFSPQGIYWIAQDVAIQKDGKIVVAAVYASPGIASDFLIYRLNSNGQPDPTFGDGGASQLQLPDYEVATAIALQKDGKIVVAGRVYPTGGPGRLMVACFLPTGAPDVGFDGDGYRIIDLPGDDEDASDVAVQKDGKIVVAGTARGATSDFALVRLTAA